MFGGASEFEAFRVQHEAVRIFRGFGSLQDLDFQGLNPKPEALKSGKGLKRAYGAYGPALRIRTLGPQKVPGFGLNRKL